MFPVLPFAKKAEQYIRMAVSNESIPVEAIASILQSRCEKLGDIPEKIDFIDTLAEYDASLYVHKKSKTDEKISLQMLIEARAALDALTKWTFDTIHDALTALAEKLNIKNATLMWPLRVAISGKAVTPGGAVELCWILGRDETLRRIASGINKLEVVGNE